MEYGKKVIVYVDDIEKWQVGELIERYAIVEENILESWRIQVITNSTAIVRYVKKSKELKMDGCGYLLEGEMETMAKIICKLSKEEV